MAATLSVSDWKKQIKPYPTASDMVPVTKALEEYAKLGSKGDPDDVIDAIVEVIARAKTAKKKNSKEKALVEILDDLIGDAEEEQDAVAREVARNPPEEEEDDEAGDMLRSMLIRVKKLDQDKALPFVVALGTVPGMVIARRPPLSRDHKNTARAMREGKGKLIMGQCFGEDGKFIFEFADKPPGGLTKVIKRAAKLHANMEIRLKVRGGGAEIDDEADLAELTDFGSEDGEVAPSAAAGATAPADLFKARAREVRVALDELKAVNPGLAATLTTEFATALGQAQAGRYDQARGRLEIIMSRIRDARKDAGAAPQGGAADGFQNRVKAITPALMEELQRGGESAQTLKLKFSEANLFSRKQDFARANTLLDQVEALLGNARARPPGAPPPSPPPPLPQSAGAFAAKFKETTALLARLEGLDGDRAEPLAAKLDEIKEQAKAREFDEALEAIQGLDGLVRSALRAAEAGSEIEMARAGEQFKARAPGTKAMIDRLKESDPGRAASLMAKFAVALGHAKAGRFIQALAQLDAVEEKAEAPAKPSGPTPADLVARAKDLQRRIAALAKAGGRDTDELTAALTEAAGRINKPGQLAEAAELLDGVEARLVGTTAAEKAALEIAAAGPVRSAGFRIARNGWDKARAAAQAQMQKFVAGVLADTIAQDQPDWQNIKTAAEKLPRRLDSFDDSLSRLIESAEPETEPTKIQPIVDDCIALIDKYRAHLTKEQAAFELLENNPYGNFKAREVLTKALDQVVAKLKS